MLYKIINPSDPYTMEADDFEVITAAIFILGGGQYPAEPVDADAKRVPAFLFGGAEEWVVETFGRTPEDFFKHVLDGKHDALVACLQSCLIGTPSDREEFDAAMALILDPVKQEAFRRERHERRRTSLNDIGGRAYAYAAHLPG